MKALQLAPNLELPAEDALEAAFAIIAKRGRGKSGAVKVLMEELVRVGLPFVAFDPVGILWGIRSSFDGSGPGLDVLVIGGAHGDLPLDRRGGATTARSIVRENVPCVIDFSEEPKAAYREFVRDFCHELFRVNDTPRMVILEEAPELVPQRLRQDMTSVFESVERLVSRGRNKGLGVVLVSQRAATINKDVLTQIDALLVMGLASPQDRKALAEWVEAWDVKQQLEKFQQGIASLHRQEAWFWSPEAFGGIFRKVKIRPFTTFHPDKTHLRRMGWLQVRAVTADVSGVVARLKGQAAAKPAAAIAGKQEVVVEEKERKAYDERIHRLERELADAARARDENARLVARLQAERIRAIPSPRMIAGALDSEAAPKTPDPGADDGSAESIRHDLHVRVENPNLTVHVREVRLDASGDDTTGRLARLFSESFFQTPRNTNQVRTEFQARGWGAWIGGAAHTNMIKALRQLAGWGFLREDGKVFAEVPEARDRVRVVTEAA